MSFSIIKNGESLVHQSVPREHYGAKEAQLREDALQILEAGYEAILTRRVMEREFVVDESKLKIDGMTFPLDAYERIFFVGMGKCALDAGEVVEERLRSWLTDGIIIDVRGAPLKKIRSHIGTHPFPSEQNILVTKSIAELLEGLTENDLLITVVSGGASSLLCLPHDLSCDSLTSIYRTLMQKGATIAEMNTVRKHTSRIHGGQFAKLAYPATVASIIFSDVPGDDISLIASGPTVRDTTTVADAHAVMKKYDLEHECALPNCELVETPKQPEYFERVHNILLVTNKTALSAMKEEAERLGYTGEVVNTELQGEAYRVGAQLTEEATSPKICRLFGGETTVSVRAQGEGGRCQEAALGALGKMRPGVVLVAAASDGWDNTPYAGALADSSTAERAKELSLDVSVAHESNASFAFFEKVGTHIDTGRTGANVSDWYFTLTS